MFRDWVRLSRLNMEDRKSTRLNSSHDQISYAVFCLKKKKRRDVHIDGLLGTSVNSRPVELPEGARAGGTKSRSPRAGNAVPAPRLSAFESSRPSVY